MNKASYFDTSVLLPILIVDHPNHENCLTRFERAMSEGTVYSTNQTCAELYSNLTKLPFNLHIEPVDAALAILEKMGKLLIFIALDFKDYEAALRLCAAKELTSGIIYDALHLQAAIKARVDRLYTANLRDFQKLYSVGMDLEIVGV